MTGRLSAAAAVPHVRAALEGGPPVVGVCVLEAERSAGASPPVESAAAGERIETSPSTETSGTDDGPRVGDHLLVWDDRQMGTLGGAAIDAAAGAAGREILDGGRPATRVVEGGGWRCTLYLEAHRAPPALVIVGAGHIARPLCRVGAMLGFRVTVLDDRPEFATRERFPEAAAVLRADFSAPFRDVAIGAGTHLVLVTRGHKYDFEALRDLLARPAWPPYVGMVGSRRRVRATLEQLAREGVPAERLRAVHAPVGLDVGAETPEEIAVAIAAEMVLVRRGGSGAPLRDRARVVERWVEPRG